MGAQSPCILTLDPLQGSERPQLLSLGHAPLPIPSEVIVLVLLGLL